MKLRYSCAAIGPWDLLLASGRARGRPRSSERIHPCPAPRLHSSVRGHRRPERGSREAHPPRRRLAGRGLAPAPAPTPVSPLPLARARRRQLPVALAAILAWPRADPALLFERAQRASELAVPSRARKSPISPLRLLPFSRAWKRNCVARSLLTKLGLAGLSRRARGASSRTGLEPRQRGVRTHGSPRPRRRRYTTRGSRTGSARRTGGITEREPNEAPDRLDSPNADPRDRLHDVHEVEQAERVQTSREPGAAAAGRPRRRVPPLPERSRCRPPRPLSQDRREKAARERQEDEPDQPYDMDRRGLRAALGRPGARADACVGRCARSAPG
jgi:hypothetical protein